MPKDAVSTVGRAQSWNGMGVGEAQGLSLSVSYIGHLPFSFPLPST